MTLSRETISHAGTIVSIENMVAKVQILSQSACASCNAKGLCASSEKKVKIVDAAIASGQEFCIGEQVNVVMNVSTGRKAVRLTYFYPALLILLSLLISRFDVSEAFVALFVVLVLCLYYFLVFLFGKKIRSGVSFRIEKIN